MKEKWSRAAVGLLMLLSLVVLLSRCGVPCGYPYRSIPTGKRQRVV